MSKTSWIVFVLLAVGVLGGLIALSRSDRVDVTAIDQTVAQEASDKNGNIADHRLGSENPKVTIMEYADFQCPGCSSAAPIMKSVVEQVGDQGVQLVFRSFPLTSIHPNARAASAAAEAAGLQGKFWEMHDVLFANQAEWQGLGSSDRTQAFSNYAASLELDIEQFEQDLTSDRVTKKIDFDIALGRKDNVSGTPAIFVNGEPTDDIRVKNGEISTDEDAQIIWSDVEAFIELIIKPKLENSDQP
jgi:protein-disulfide isomerase